MSEYKKVARWGSRPASLSKKMGAWLFMALIENHKHPDPMARHQKVRVRTASARVRPVSSWGSTLSTGLAEPSGYCPTSRGDSFITRNPRINGISQKSAARSPKPQRQPQSGLVTSGEMSGGSMKPAALELARRSPIARPRLATYHLDNRTTFMSKPARISPSPRPACSQYSWTSDPAKGYNEKHTAMTISPTRRVRITPKRSTR